MPDKRWSKQDVFGTDKEIKLVAISGDRIVAAVTTDLELFIVGYPQQPAQRDVIHAFVKGGRLAIVGLFRKISMDLPDGYVPEIRGPCD